MYTNMLIQTKTSRGLNNTSFYLKPFAKKTLTLMVKFSGTRTQWGHVGINLLAFTYQNTKQEAQEGLNHPTGYKGRSITKVLGCA